MRYEQAAAGSELRADSHEGKVKGEKLQLRMTLTSENTPALSHVVEAIIDLD